MIEAIYRFMLVALMAVALTDVHPAIGIPLAAIAMAMLLQNILINARKGGDAQQQQR